MHLESTFTEYYPYFILKVCFEKRNNKKLLFCFVTCGCFSISKTDVSPININDDMMFQKSHQVVFSYLIGYIDIL